MNRLNMPSSNMIRVQGWKKQVIPKLCNKYHNLIRSNLLQTPVNFYRCRQCWQDYCRSLERERKRIIFSWYGGSCRCCGEFNLDFLTLDHINDDGNIQRLRGRSGLGLYRKIFREGVKNRPKDLQILCFNCNMGKQINHGFCSHHPKTDLRKKV